MSLKLPNLQILEISKLITHEWHDQQRTPPLIDKFRSSGFLRNPPIVIPFADDSDQYMVLDGANRTAALKKMGVPHVIAQVVNAQDTTLELKTWNHVLWNMNSGDLIGHLQQIDNFNLSEYKFNSNHGDAKGWDNEELIWVETSDNKVWVGINESNNLHGRIETLNAIVNSYKDRAKMDRTPSTSAKELAGMYDDFYALVVFPHFEVAEVLKLCKEGLLFPAGITRFTISPRALRVNYPLDNLSAEKTLAEKNAALAQWVQERVARKGVRVYSEATVLFDE